MTSLIQLQFRYTYNRPTEIHIRVITGHDLREPEFESGYHLLASLWISDHIRIRP